MKPILFNTEMVKAILDGRKTVTRRVVKPQHLQVLDSPYHKKHPETPDAVLIEKLCLPPYQVGDILYVRETWRPCSAWGGSYTGCEIEYKAGGTKVFDYIIAVPKKNTPWRPSIHMPKEAARIFLRVTDVRVERLQETFFAEGTTVLSIISEGINVDESCKDCVKNYNGYPCCFDKSENDECCMLDENRYIFSRLWDSTIKPIDRDRYGWYANPWVWVIEFERIGREEAYDVR